MIKDIAQDYGIKLPNLKVWRGKEIAMIELHGTEEDAYNRFPAYLNHLLETNPIRHVTMQKGSDNKFRRVFISLVASTYGFKNGNCPIIFLDGTHLKARFLENLKNAIGMDQPITFISDRHIGLVDNVSDVFRNSHHAFCERHMTKNLRNGMKHIRNDVKNAIISAFQGVTRSFWREEFNLRIADIQNYSQEAFTWVATSTPERWATSIFRGKRFGQVTTIVADSFNNWILEARELPIL
ncbi:uncharacterized protein LOC110007691 [Amborella trichopoda]|uniref:uncharacterized protein LOC110007691 n=1 Tax=Amborella trichopoda TaxID=13333 RepID=UPI0009BEE82A|nr:uncharacterized protein LOC110007691 [Amborella trichopoda]|eukprot:XP_020525869.1 uncharacterized protein LOC110007691 [Amborella trichopoda]